MSSTILCLIMFAVNYCMIKTSELFHIFNFLNGDGIKDIIICLFPKWKKAYLMWIYQSILPKHGCTSNYKALASLGLLQMKSLQTSCRLMEMQYIFGYHIGTVNMDRCHGCQISRALNFLGLREHSL